MSILFVLISFVCMAANELPTIPPPPGPPPFGLPIDGGVLTGVLVALFYGAKRMLFQK